MSGRSYLAAIALSLIALTSIHLRDPHADWFVIASLMVFGLAPRAAAQMLAALILWTVCAGVAIGALIAGVRQMRREVIGNAGGVSSHGERDQMTGALGNKREDARTVPRSNRNEKARGAKLVALRAAR